MPDAGFILGEVLPSLNKGLYMSLALIVPSSVFGFMLGVGVGVARVFGSKGIRRICDCYTALFRGVPLAIQLMIIYFGLPNLGIYFEPYTAAVLTFVLCSGAYQSEYIRGALLSIRKGQIRAAESLGFSTMQTVMWIIIPQATRRALPGCGNEIIYLIKYSSLAYLVTCMELTGEAKAVASASFRFTEVFLAVGFYYLMLVTVATALLHRLEKKFNIPGFGIR